MQLQSNPSTLKLLYYRKTLGQELNSLKCFCLLLKSLILTDGDTCALNCEAYFKAQRASDFAFIFLLVTLQHSTLVRALNFSTRHNGLKSQLLVPTDSAPWMSSQN